MGTRVPGQRTARPHLLPFLNGALVGALIAAALVFLAMHRSPDQPGTGPCAEAAERWAQIDETAKWDYARSTGKVYIPSDELVLARGQAGFLLDDCRAAGS